MLPPRGCVRLSRSCLFCPTSPAVRTRADPVAVLSGFTCWSYPASVSVCTVVDPLRPLLSCTLCSVHCRVSLRCMLLSQTQSRSGSSRPLFHVFGGSASVDITHVPTVMGHKTLRSSGADKSLPTCWMPSWPDVRLWHQSTHCKLQPSRTASSSYASGCQPIEQHVDDASRPRCDGLAPRTA